MMRFMVPTLGLLAAMLVLFAGAYGDLPSWRRDLPVLIAQFRAPPGDAVAAVAAPTAPDAERDRLNQRDQDLRARITRETNELAALHASVEQARQDLASLREQQRKQRAAMTAEAAPPAATPSPAPVVAPATTPAEPPAAHPAAVAIPDQQLLLASRRLVAARGALQTGRLARTRWLLNLTHAQMLHWPVAPAANGDTPAALVASGLEVLAHGDRGAATQAIDQALAALGVPTRQASISR